MLTLDGNNFLDAFLQANKRLVQTLVVKSNINAGMINDGIIKKFGQASVDLYDPKTWKYYLNLEGRRHFTNEIVLVDSLDTHETIEFTPENLALHPATKQAYAYGSKYYYSLLARYKAEESLIRGVLNPVTFDISEDAAEGSILTYQADLVEPQESTLIYDLQEFIQGYIARWHISGFRETDKYFMHAMWAVLGLLTYDRLLTLRHARCKTEQAHSFFIREYLASFGRLDRFIPYLNLEQILYLYRNVKYLQRNSGSTQQFQELIDKILVKRRLPLAEFSVSHMNSFGEDGYINLAAKRKSLTKVDRYSQYKYLEMTDLYDKIARESAANADYLARHQKSETHRFKITASSVTQTKTLESAIIDYGDAMPDPIMDVLMREWGHMAHVGLYKAKIFFTDPLTGKSLELSASDAFVYANYLSHASTGIELDHAPSAMVEKFRLVKRPKLDEMLACIPTRYSQTRQKFQELYLAHPVKTQCTAVSSFNDYATRVFQCCLQEWLWTCNCHELYANGLMRTGLAKMYGKALLKPDIPDWQAWLKRNNLKPQLYSYEQMAALAFSIFQAATGYNSGKNKTLKDVQRQLINLFKELSSYSIQVLTKSNDSRVILVGSLGSTFCSSTDASLSGSFVAHNDLIIKEVAGAGSHFIHQPTREDLTVRLINIPSNPVIKLAPVTDAVSAGSEIETILHSETDSSLNRVYIAHEVVKDAPGSTVVGQILFDRLTEEQKSSIKLKK